MNRQFHKYFSKAFSEMETSDSKLLKIGCVRSAWLPYFAKEFGSLTNQFDCFYF